MNTQGWSPLFFYFYLFIYLFYFLCNFFISWRLIILQYCSGFCHTLTWISHGYTCRLISFRMDWLDLLAVQGTLKSLLQHHNSKASILWCSTSFMVQLSHPYMTTEKAITLIRQNLPGNIMSLLFNMLPRFVIAFLPRRFPISVRLIEIGVDLLTIICSILSSLLWSCLRAGTYLGNPSVLTRHSTYIYQMNKWMHSEMNM